MRTGLTIAVWLLATQFVSGQVIMVTDAGYWVSQVSSQGVPTWQKAATVLDYRTDAPNPDPDSLAKKSETWARQVNDPETALGLAEVYRIGGEQLASGGVNDEQSLMLVSMLTDEVLKAQDATEAWKQWRANVSGEITKARQDGTYGIKTLGSVETGLRDSTDGQAFNIENLIRLLEILIPLILKIIAGL